MNKIYNFIHKYKKEIIVILILIIIIIFIYYFYNKHNYEGFFTTTTPITIPKWDLLGEPIIGTSADGKSGYQVSLSADGTIVAIGSPSNRMNYLGHVSIFKYNKNKWDLIGAPIPGISSGSESGYSVSLSGDGAIVAIGEPYGNNSLSGQVRIFQYNENKWGQLGEPIHGTSEGDYSGWSVSLSGDGTIVAIGAPYNDGIGRDSGQVRIFQLNGNIWKQLGNHILGEAKYDQSGSSVLLSSDGYTVAIGTPLNDGIAYNSGHVRIFKYNENNEIKWGQLGQSILGTSGGDKSGYSVSLSGDGYTVAIGTPLNDGIGSNSGQVRIYKYNENKWDLFGAHILGTSEGDQSGHSVSLSSDGTILAIGEPFTDHNGKENSGQVRLYKISPIDCIGSFVNKGICSTTCGPGDQVQEYNITTPAQYGGDSCSNNQVDKRTISCNLTPCPINCIGSYGEFNECSATCGPGTKTKTYKITTQAQYGGITCPISPPINEACNTRPCPINCIGSFVDKGVCSTTCGPGNQEQEYKITNPAQYGGASCSKNQDDIRTVSCNLTPCPIDCIGSFGDYDTCSEDCGGGTQTRTYTITQEEKNNGKKCPHTNGYTEDKECNPDPCPINCVGDFVPFKDCSRECDGGIYQEIYNITKEAQYGGVSCNNKQNDLKTTPCNTQPCPIYAENTTLQEALKESNNKIQNIRYNIIDRQEELDTLTNKFNLLNKNISKIKTSSNYVPDDKTLTFY